MKNLKKYAIMLLGLAFFASCEPTEVPEIGTARDVLTSFSGTYTVSKVTQIDEGAVKKGFPYKTLNVTSFYTGLKATFNVSVDKAPTTFTFTPGASGNSIGTLNAGSWTVDNAKAPNEITLSSGGTTSKLIMGNYTLLDANKMMLKVVRKQGANVVLTYEFEFTKN
jgi:hypothetical protein